MDDLLGQFNLLKKPVPARKKRVGVRMRPKGAIQVNVRIVDKSEDDVDRQALLANVYTRAIVKIPKHRIKAVPQSPAERLADILNKKTVTDVAVEDIAIEEKKVDVPTSVKRSAIKVKRKRGKIRIGKSIRKGTITALAPPVVKIQGKRKRARIKRDLGTVESYF